jgi:hypothetical protein
MEITGVQAWFLLGRLPVVWLSPKAHNQLFVTCQAYLKMIRKMEKEANSVPINVPEIFDFPPCLA